MSRLCFVFALVGIGSLSACTAPDQPSRSGDPGAQPGVALKRASLWVSDLDEAIAFYRDVLGFALVQRGPLTPNTDSVLWELFNLPPGTAVERALFSSADADRVLFIMAAPGAPKIKSHTSRSPALVVATSDLDRVTDRALSLGFAVGKHAQSQAGSDPARQLDEQVLIGPEGQPVLVYQLRARNPEAHRTDGGVRQSEASN